MSFVIRFVVISLFLVNNVYAQGSVRDEINILKQRISNLEKQLQDQQQKQNFTLTFDGRPRFRTKDNKKSFFLDGRIMVDSGFVTSGKTSNQKNSISLRRAWIGFGGDVNDWFYRGLFGFENNEVSVIDAFIGYKVKEGSDILVGNFFENHGIEGETPNLISPFMERSASFTTFRKLRRVGVSYNSLGYNYGIRLGAFGTSVDNTQTDDKGQGVAFRGYYLPINDHKNYHNLHLGLNYTYRTPDSADSSLRYSSAGNSDVIDDNLIDTGLIMDVDNYNIITPEFRYQYSRFSIAAEYFRTHINRNGLNLRFDSSYILASYFLTDSKYRYHLRNGAPIDVSNKKGAIEIAGRFSNVDLNNLDVRGGKLKSYDFGVNYYFDENVRLMFNYIYNDVAESDYINKNPQYFMTRLQLWF